MKKLQQRADAITAENEKLNIKIDADIKRMKALTSDLGAYIDTMRFRGQERLQGQVDKPSGRKGLSKFMRLFM